MLTATTALARIRTHFDGECKDLLNVVLNSTSAAEANLAVEVLRKTVPAKVLVDACNLREILRSLPASPFPMRVDEDTLCRVGGFEQRIAAMGKRLPDGIELVVTTAGNLVLDIIIKHQGEKYFWNPTPVTDDFVSAGVIDLLIDSDHLLDAVIELAGVMGITFNPRFYLSIEDWHMEYAADVFEGLGELF